MFFKRTGKQTLRTDLDIEITLRYLFAFIKHIISILEVMALHSFILLFMSTIQSFSYFSTTVGAVSFGATLYITSMNYSIQLNDSSSSDFFTLSQRIHKSVLYILSQTFLFLIRFNCGFLIFFFN